MDLTLISNLLSSINPTILGGVAGGTLLCCFGVLYVKNNKGKFFESGDILGQSSKHATLKTEDLEREFGSVTVQTKVFDDDEDEKLFFDKKNKSGKGGARKDTSKKDSPVGNPSILLVDEASVLDSFGKREQAIELLKKSIEVEKHEKEKVRLKMIFSQYSKMNGKGSLDALLKEYPSFHATASFDPENTISALIAAVVPKNDMRNMKNNVSLKNRSNVENDLFADLPTLNDNHLIQKSNLSRTEPLTNSRDNNRGNPLVSSGNRDMFSDIPPIKGAKIPTSPQYVSPQPIIPAIRDLPKVDQFSWKSDNGNVALSDPLSRGSSSNSVKTIEERQNMKTQSENLNPVNPKSSTDSGIEVLLSGLQQDAQKSDAINDREAMEDMNKFMQEWNGLVGDALGENATKESGNSNKISNKISNEDSGKHHRVWVNWIVNKHNVHEFRNHFINLSNPWGTELAAIELINGINAKFISGTDNKPFPWVLVSVFPITK